MYLKSKKIFDFDFKFGFLLNKNGIVERHIEKKEVKDFYIHIKRMDHNILGSIIKKAFNLDLEIKKLVDKLNVNLNKIYECAKLSSIYLVG